MDQETKNYEIVYLIHPDVPEDQVFGEAGKVTSFIQDAHGIVGRIEEPKKRRLAYPMEKLTSAYFGCTTFTAAPERIAAIKKRLAAEKNIIRSMLNEEVKRPVFEPRFRPDRPLRAVPHVPLEEVKAFEPQAPKEEDKTKIEELDKQLEEILGK